jgi:4-amino-4-deoxy-L-arabinose transferase-like glycosyltransferase
MLDNIVTMEKSMVSYHMPETKNQSKQWIKKGLPIKARVHASRMKQMLLAFFDSKGLIYTDIVPRGTSINANYIIKPLGKFLVHLKYKRPEIVQLNCFSTWTTRPSTSPPV